MPTSPVQAPLPSCGCQVTNFWRVIEPEPLPPETFNRDLVCKLNDAFQTPLHLAVAKGRLGPVERILDSMHFDAKTFATQDIENRTALHYAAVLPRLDIFEMLVQHPFATSNVLNLTDSNGQTALDILADRAEIDMLDKLGFAKDLWEKRDAFGQTILHRNILHSSPTQIKKILEHPFMNARIFDAVNHEGQTALHLATLSRNPEILEALLSHPFMTPATASFKDKEGASAKTMCGKYAPQTNTNHLKVLTNTTLLNKFVETHQKTIECFLPPLNAESGLHYKGLIQCFDPSAYPYLSFAPILNKPKRIDQIRIFGRDLAARLHLLKAVLDIAVVHQEKNFRVEVRFVKNRHIVFMVNQENWFGTEEAPIFGFEHLSDQKLQDFINILWGSPIGIASKPPRL